LSVRPTVKLPPRTRSYSSGADVAVVVVWVVEVGAVGLSSPQVTVNTTNKKASAYFMILSSNRVVNVWGRLASVNLNLYSGLSVVSLVLRNDQTGKPELTKQFYNPTSTALTTSLSFVVPIGQQVDRLILLVELSINWVWSVGA